MTPSLALVEFVAGWEELRTHAYLDAVGVPTIGYGTTQGVSMGDICTPEQAAEWLNEDLQSYGIVLEGYMHRDPTQQQFDALLSLAYNVGANSIGTSGVMARFNAGLDRECADRFLMWNKAGGKMLPGLSRRRAAERAIYLDGDYSGRP